MQRARALLVLVLAATLPACRSSDDPDRVAPSAPPPTTAPPKVTSARSAKSAASAAPRPTTLEVLRFRLTSNVEKKEPVDDLVSAAPGERVWAHATIRNRTKETRHITLIFRVDGDERTTVDLKVEPSWSWRTYGYVTLRPTDKEGVLTVELRDDKAELLDQKALTIRERK